MFRKKTKCFTLMELLVVISVIALLLAVLMPSLRKAKEMAGRIVCGNNERQLAMANDLYANNWDEQYCPPMMQNKNMPEGPEDDKDRYRKVPWPRNPEFKKCIALDDKQVVTRGDAIIMPDEYFCPADKLARYDQRSEDDVLISYAYNVAEWYYPKDVLDCFWSKGCKCDPQPWQIGHKRTAVRRSSEKINFMDSCDWWATWQKGANYKIAWDLLGQAPPHSLKVPDYASIGVYGPVLYRHNEGANFAFYDGHVAHIDKEKAYVEEEGISPLQDATDMWFVNYGTYE